MLIAAALLFQQAATTRVAVDSTYASAALRTAVELGATANRTAPAALKAYRARLESEIALIIVDTLGRERTGQIEQMGGTATWNTVTGYDAHVAGYRSQAAGIPFSMLSVFRGWSLPMLYGERLVIGIEGVRDSARARRQPTSRDTATTIVAVHPFAGDRDKYYRFEGGDTVATLTTADRRIPLMRIHVIPDLRLDVRFAAFEGDLDIDATRGDIVRMRGKFVVSRAAQSSYSGMSKLMLRATGTVGVAYAEFINAEYDGRYWLPATQRIEFQATIAMLAGARSVIRIMSRFSDLAIDDTSHAEVTAAAYRRRVVTFAPPDSMSSFDQWLLQMGTATAAVGANDFDDVAPPQWKADGPPRLTLYPSRLDRLVHYNRVEGLFTGAELSFEARGLSPGLVARAHAGWAWSEQTMRGGASVRTARGSNLMTVRLERGLSTTNDFNEFFEDGGSSLAALLASEEDVDYVDRRTADLSFAHVVGSIDRGLITARLAAIRDVDVPATLTHGPVARSVEFRPNRHARTGTYGLGSLQLEFHPSVAGEFVAPGFGASVRVETAAGDLTWTRVDAAASLRKYLGPVTVGFRGDVGSVFSPSPPPQTLYEIGGGVNRLPGYAYKEFAGDRAAVFWSTAMWNFPLFRAPHRFGRYLIPGLTPGIGAGIQGGWTEISSPGAQAAVLELGDGTVANALSHATDGVRSSVGFGLTFFSGSAHVGIARPLDHPSPWRWVFGLGQSF